MPSAASAPSSAPPADPPSHPDPIRLCMVTAAIPLGGAERLQMAVLAGLNALGMRCEVLCLREAGQMAPQFEEAGIPVTVMARRRAQHALTVPVLARWFRERRTDVVFCTTHVPALHLGLVAARLAGVRGTMLGLHQTGGVGIGLPSLPRRSVDLLFLLDALVLLSREQLDYVRTVEGYGTRPWRRPPFAIIPNGVPVGPPPDAAARAAARADLGLTPADEVVGCVAALRPEKDHETLLRALVRVAQVRPAARLVLVGSGPREDAVRAAVDEMGLGDRVVFAGFRTDVERLLPAFDVFCLSSVQETYPVSVLEAMAASLPVVMTDPPGVPEVVAEGRTGHRVPVGDDAEMAARLGALLADPAMRVRMGAAGRDRVEREFSFDRTLGRYAALVSELAGRRDALQVRTGPGPRHTYGIRRV